MRKNKAKFLVIAVAFSMLFQLCTITYAAGDTATNDEEDLLLQDLIDDGSEDLVLDEGVLDRSDEVMDILNTIESAPLVMNNYKKAGDVFANYGEKGIKVFADGYLIDFKDYDNVQPVIEAGRTLVPVRAISENLGAEVAFDKVTKKIKIQLEDNTIELTLGSNNAKVGKNNVTLDVPAKVINDRTMVPLRFISESFGRKVEFIPNTAKTLSVIAITEK